jgi:APA family basic amino acid/polyamine antiporter
MELFRKIPVMSLLEETVGKRGVLKKSLGPFDLTMLGIGAIIGTGIFVLTGITAALHAGPALVVSFLIAGMACVFAALCYCELASSIPVSGSVYTYSYAAFGEIVAWVLGWDLILEYGLSCSAVAVGWSAYMQSFLAGFGVHLPAKLSGAFYPGKGTWLDLPAVVIVVSLTLLMIGGVQRTVKFNAVMVVVKIVVVLLFILLGVAYVRPQNWSPFMPFGFSGVSAGAATVFFAFIGFDAVSTAAEEVRNPQRSMPIGIIASLAVCSLLYILVSAVLTGMVPYHLLNVNDPVSFALKYIGLDWAAGFISLGAIAGITSVLMAMLYGLARLIFAISRDGLLFAPFGRIHPRKQTPVVGSWAACALAGVFAGIVPLEHLAGLSNIGTLFAFIAVPVGLLALRRQHPDLPRAFKVPFVPWLPLISVAFCGYLALQLPLLTWLGFAAWLVVGLTLYFCYGYRHSRLSMGGK